MDIYDITKLELAIRNNELKGKSKEQLEEYLQQEVLPVLLTHLTAKPKVNWAVICTGSSGGGGVSCTGSIGGSL